MRMSRCVILPVFVIRRLRHDSAGALRAFVCVALLAVSAAAPVRGQQGSVAGVIIDARTERPIAGVQVSVIGTRQGAVTDAAGRFTIPDLLRDEVQLQAVMLGYRTATVPARAGETSLRIALQESALSLDEIVVTGTPASTQRRAVGNAVATVRASDVTATQPISNVQELLNGRASGVTYTPGTGRIGGGGTIHIRGRSTMSLSQQPLLYVDGVRVANDFGTGPRGQGNAIVSRLNDINPEDIESIEVIKGPAAATIYGTEAANGVIQVITKKGGLGQRPEFAATIRHGTNWFANAHGRIPTNFAMDSLTGEIVQWHGVAQEEARGTPIWNNGTIRSYGLSVRGGGQQVGYYLSAGFDADDGIQSDNRNRRFTGHAALDLTPSDRLDVSSSVNVTRARTHLGADFGLGSIFAVMYGLPLDANKPTRGFNIAPPDVIREVIENTQAVNRYTGTVQATHRPASWFTHRLTAGLDQTSEDNQSLTRFMTPEQAQFFTPTTARGSLLQDLRTIGYITADYNGTITAPLTTVVGSATSVGAQYYRRRTDQVVVSGREFPLPGLRTAAAAATQEGSQDYVENTTIGMFAQQQFDLHNRLFLTGAVRVDNNSAFGDEFEWATYPKVSASWLISEEPFWRLGFVDQLRLRTAYGASGQQPEAFAALQTYQPTTGPGGRAIATPQFPGNPELKPERGEEIEVGFDAELFGRVSLEFTFFDKQTRDAILQRQSPPSGGFPNAQFVNIGRVSNRGVEAMANVRAIETPDVVWNVVANVGTSRDRIEDLGGLPPIVVGLPVQQHREGYPIAAYFTKGVLRADFDAATGTTSNPICDDGNGGEVPCAQAPAVFFGTITPKLVGSVSNDVTIRERLRLNVMLDFKTGHMLFNTDALNRCAVFQVCRGNVEPETIDPRVLATWQRGSTLQYLDAFLEDASFAKLREVSVSYTIPESWLHTVGANRTVLSLAARNLHTWTGFTGLDPERRIGVTAANQNLAIDQAVMPQLVELVATLRVNF